MDLEEEEEDMEWRPPLAVVERSILARYTIVVCMVGKREEDWKLHACFALPLLRKKEKKPRSFFIRPFFRGG